MTNRVWIEKTGNTLRLRWNYKGKVEALSLGLPDDRIGRGQAQITAKEIAADLVSGNYDPTKLKYDRRKGEKSPDITAVALFEKYSEFINKDKDLSKQSRDRYKSIARKLPQLLGEMPAAKVTKAVAKKVMEAMAETLSASTVKTYLFLIRAAWNWAQEQGKYRLAEGDNPWDDCIDRVKVQAKKFDKPFTSEELKLIVEAFKSDRHFSAYTDFVIFLGNTGCRIGEAAGLRWENINLERSTAWIGESISRGVPSNRGTKTGKTRIVDLNSTVRSMLMATRDRVNPQPNDLVFPSPKGLPIDDHNFRTRAWKTILEQCQVEYRSPYNLRHSAISHALDNGANPIALAEQTGHDKRVLLSTYAHAIRSECLFPDLGVEA